MYKCRGRFRQGAVSPLLQQSTRYRSFAFSVFSFFFGSCIFDRQLRSDRSSGSDWWDRTALGCSPENLEANSTFLFFRLLTPDGIGLCSLSTCGCQSQTAAPRPLSLTSRDRSGCVTSNYLNCADPEKLKKRSGMNQNGFIENWILCFSFSKFQVLTLHFRSG